MFRKLAFSIFGAGLSLSLISGCHLIQPAQQGATDHIAATNQAVAAGIPQPGLPIGADPLTVALYALGSGAAAVGLLFLGRRAGKPQA
tara:strand:- start:68 stop:331 length:264 start_codon:yes stop_codon:yes gene_type:complete